MSLLSICANAADNVGVSRPTSIIGNTDAGAVRLLQLARRAAKSIALKANWVALVVEHEFIASSMSNYAMPSDYRSMIGNTVWERNRYWQLRGALSPQQWQRNKASLLGSASINRNWRIHVPSGNAAGVDATFSIDPSISTGIDAIGDFIIGTSAIGGAGNSPVFVFEYVSNHWCRSGTTFSLVRLVTNTTGINYVAGDVLTLAGGTSTTAATILVTAVTSGAITGAQIVNPGVYTVLPTSPASVTGGSGTTATFITSSTVFGRTPQADWAADTDTALIDENLIELSVIWRLQDRLGVAYAEAKEEYERELDKAIARDGGSTTLSLLPGIWASDDLYLADPGIVLTNEAGDFLTSG